MKHTIISLMLFLSTTISAKTIVVKYTTEDATQRIQQAIDEARKHNGKPITIRFESGNYHISRANASKHLYFVSNTASESENPDQTKHIGLWIKDAKNLTIDGNGAFLITHGEMTPFAIDKSENITIKNISIKASDPTVPEMMVIERGDKYIVAKAHTLSNYTITDGRFAWVGKSWTLTGGIAQLYDPITTLNIRHTSPLSNLEKAIELELGLIRFNYKDKAPTCKPGQVFQMRDGIRDEVAGLVNLSKNIHLQNIGFHFMGNFGIVSQVSENLNYDRLLCEPEYGKERINVGFADFLQFSGCKGKIKVTNSRFIGAHDDPINIHGTHLRIVEYPTDNQIKIRFMHPQTYGLEQFFSGDYIDIVDANSLLCLQQAKIKKVERINDRDILLTLNSNISNEIKTKPDVVVENTTWTPEVEINNNFFASIPTRGILVTTRKKIIIENNIFLRMPMSAILIANEGRSWFESGPVADVTIRNNLFIECGSPVICIAPENGKYEGALHKNISICDNRFDLLNADAIFAKATNGLLVKDNFFITNSSTNEISQLIRTEQCENVTVKDNRIEAL
ncbi:MAG: alpha-1,3-galactosidase-related protein [Tannerellaceae bacterium]